ncbi:ATP-binding protein [Listeria monocytogenes]
MKNLIWKKKSAKKAENTVNINKEFLSTIAPEGGITFKEDRYVKTGNGYEACIHVIDTPVNVGQYWLADIINRDDTVVVLDVVSENRAVTLKKLKKAMSEQQSRTFEERTIQEKYSAQYELEVLEDLNRQIAEQGEIIKEIHIRIYVAASDTETLDKKVGIIKEDLDGRSFRSSVFLFEEKDEWLSKIISIDEQKKLPSKRPGKGVPASTLGAGYFLDHTFLNDKTGFPLATTATGGSFIWDIFTVNGKRTFFNAIVLGNMGMGKSTLLKLIEEDAYAKNYFIRGYDKVRDYEFLVKQQKGKYLTLDGTDGKLNPLDIYATATKGEEASEIDIRGSFQQHISKVCTLFQFMSRDATDSDLKVFEQLLISFYVHKKLWGKNISDEELEKIGVVNLAPEKYPTMSEFLHYAEEVFKVKSQHGISTNMQMMYEKVILTLRNMVESYGDVFDGITTMRDFSDEQVVFFDIRGLSNMKQQVFHAQLYMSLTLIWNHAMQHGMKVKRMIEAGEISFAEAIKTLIFIDECHNLINESNIFAVETITNFQREMRKFLTGILLATQSPNEMLPDGMDSSTQSKLRTVFNLTQYKFLMGMDSSVIPKLKSVMEETFTQNEYEIITALDKGQALYYDREHKMLLDIEASPDQLSRYKGGA